MPPGAKPPPRGEFAPYRRRLNNGREVPAGGTHRAPWGRMHDLQATVVDADCGANDTAPRHLNSVDATTGQPIVARVMARRGELEALLEALPEGDLGTQGDIYRALATINDLLTGDLANVPAVVVVGMNRWLERNKHLAERVAATASPVEG
jgi:hypothetical protein